VESLVDLRRHPARLALFSPEVEEERLQEKRYLYDTLYTCGPLETEHDKAEEVVTTLFNHWINDPEELPVSHFEEVENEGLARVVADYIAGMTDSFILHQYAQIKRAIRF
jgi:dGTPase